jgi:uncharacterized protein (DUF2141 family)
VVFDVRATSDTMASCVRSTAANADTIPRVTVAEPPPTFKLRGAKYKLVYAMYGDGRHYTGVYNMRVPGDIVRATQNNAWFGYDDHGAGPYAMELAHTRNTLPGDLPLNHLAMVAYVQYIPIEV